MRPDTTYDPDADAAYFTFATAIAPGQVAETREVAPNVMLDFDAQGRLLGLEVLGARAVLVDGPWMSAGQPGVIAAE